MDSITADIHQVGDAMIHLVWQPAVHTGRFAAMIEGGGIFLAHEFDSEAEAVVWLKDLFTHLHAGHVCSLGCIRLPGSKFLAPLSVLDQMAAVEDRHPPG